MFKTKVYISILMLMLPVCAIAQNQTFSGCVIDAQTGEVMPYVRIWASTNNGAVSNSEGNFSINTNPNANLRFSYIGYKTVEIKASVMGSKVMMNPVAQEIPEVTILSDNLILSKVAQKLRHDYRKHRSKKNNFFNRICISYPNSQALAESFMGVRSAVNIRNMEVFSGRYWGRDPSGNYIDDPLKHTNVQMTMALSPIVYDNTFWTRILPITTPFSKSAKSANYKKYYDTSSEVMQGEGNQTIYRITLKRNSNSPKKILCGTLYVDAKTFDLLQFDGNLYGQKLSVVVNAEEFSYDADIKLHINYNHSKGYCDVDNMSYDMDCGEIQIHSTLVGVDSSVKPTSYGVPIEENLIDAIKEAGFNAELEQKYNILRRTEGEEKIVNK